MVTQLYKFNWLINFKIIPFRLKKIKILPNSYINYYITLGPTHTIQFHFKL